MRIGQMIKLWLACKEITLQEMATDIGISKSTLSRISKGETVDAKTLLFLLYYFFEEVGDGK